MLAAAGVHTSCLRAVAAHRRDRARCEGILLGALLPATVLAALAVLAFLLLAEPLAGWLSSPWVAEGMRWAAPGLFFFALNKSLLGVENGLRRMRAFAVFQALRYLLVLAAFAWAHLEGVGPERLPMVFSLAEGLLFPLLLFDVSRQLSWWRGREALSWSRHHLSFGIRNVASGMLLELNTRVDVLMLGTFLGDAEVGIYSFAALFAEGFYQLFVVLQNNYNPLLASQLAAGRKPEVESLVRRGRRASWMLGAAGGVLAVAVYPLIQALFTNDPLLDQSLLPFAILIAGQVLAAGYLPFQGYLAMANLPGWHTLFLLGTVLLNALGNACAIPLLGIAGAAVATGLSFGASALLLRSMGWRLTGVRL
jgi:O-antigen/teichoic acid export membrane protein